MMFILLLVLHGTPFCPLAVRLCYVQNVTELKQKKINFPTYIGLSLMTRYGNVISSTAISIHFIV